MKYVKWYEEEPNYVRQKKEISVDPQILSKIVRSREIDAEQAEINTNISRIREKKIRIMWKVAKKVLKNKPNQFRILYLKYYVGMAEPQIAKQLSISQPWVRCNVLSAVNLIRKRLKFDPLKTIVENPNMVRDRAHLKKHKHIAKDE